MERENDVKKDNDIDKLSARLIIINTNVRSLCPKVNSLLDCFNELRVGVGIVTETWLREGSGLEEDVNDFVDGTGFGLLNLCRKPTDRGVLHGGVSIAYLKNTCELNVVNMQNPNDFEVLVASGSLRGHARKLVVIACYLPPNYTVPRANACLAHITDVVLEARRRYTDPYILVGGDFNQWDIASALVDYIDIAETDVGPTRGDRSIDRLFSNFHRSVIESGTLPPLETCLLYTSPSPRD